MEIQPVSWTLDNTRLPFHLQKQWQKRSKQTYRNKTLNYFQIVHKHLNQHNCKVALSEVKKYFADLKDSKTGIGGVVFEIKTILIKLEVRHMSKNAKFTSLF